MKSHMSLKYLVFVGLFTLAMNFEGHKFLRERYVMSRNAWNCSEVAGVVRLLGKQAGDYLKIKPYSYRTPFLFQYKLKNF